MSLLSRRSNDMGDKPICHYEGCTLVAEFDGVCQKHDYSVRAEAHIGTDALGDHLRLAAEFEAWCAANGQPPPND